MYFIKRNNVYIDMTNQTFNEYLINGHYDNDQRFEATITDWVDHITTLFPQVRLKQFMEVRSMDACSWNLICAPAAFWTGILYDAESLEEAEILSKDWTNQDRKVLNLSVPEARFKIRVLEIQIFLEIAKKLLFNF